MKIEVATVVASYEAEFGTTQELVCEIAIDEYYISRATNGATSGLVDLEIEIVDIDFDEE